VLESLNIGINTYFIDQNDVLKSELFIGSIGNMGDLIFLLNIALYATIPKLIYIFCWQEPSVKSDGYFN